MTDATATPAPSVPGKTLGVVGLILSIIVFTSMLGLILSIVAKVQSNNAGVKNGPATAGIVIGIIWIVLGIIGVIIATVGGASLLGMCAGLEPGVYTLENGGTLTCG